MGVGSCGSGQWSLEMRLVEKVAMCKMNSLGLRCVPCRGGLVV